LNSAHQITRIRGYFIDNPPQTPVRFTGQDPATTSSIELIRIELANGVEGIAGSSTGWFGSESGVLLSNIETLSTDVIGQDIHEHQNVTRGLINRHDQASLNAISILDIAMWDAYGQVKGQPIYEILGEQQTSIPAYASTPAFLSIDEYFDITQDCINSGYRGIKYHMNCDPEFDREMVTTIDRIFPNSGIRFMVDLEQRYTLDEAVALGEILARLPYDWMEAPLADSDIAGYIELNGQVNIDILPAGNTLLGIEQWEQGLASKAWSRLRCGANNAGGITAVIDAINLAERFQIPVELQSFGYITNQMSNLHLMHSSRLCTWFEHPFPYENYEFAANSKIHLDNKGRVSAASANGLGLSLDWRKIEVAANRRFDIAL
jgi:L-alanine-DL-glutamate epimerase-like enolase superfamily enzyme